MQKEISKRTAQADTVFCDLSAQYEHDLQIVAELLKNISNSEVSSCAFVGVGEIIDEFLVNKRILEHAYLGREISHKPLSLNERYELLKIKAAFNEVANE